MKGSNVVSEIACDPRGFENGDSKMKVGWMKLDMSHMK